MPKNTVGGVRLYSFNETGNSTWGMTILPAEPPTRLNGNGWHRTVPAKSWSVEVPRIRSSQFPFSSPALAEETSVSREKAAMRIFKESVPPIPVYSPVIRRSIPKKASSRKNDFSLRGYGSGGNRRRRGGSP